MNYCLQHKDAFTVIGFSTYISPNEGYRKCPEFWDKEYTEKYARLWQTMQPQNEEESAIIENKIGMFALCIDGENGFEYMIAGTYQGGEVPNSMRLFQFPESDWLVFASKGPLPYSLQHLNTEIWQKWYPNEGHNFLPNGNTTVEFYSNGNPTADDYAVEIWIPVMQKNNL